MQSPSRVLAFAAFLIAFSIFAHADEHVSGDRQQTAPSVSAVKPGTDDVSDKMIREVLSRTNLERARAGLPALKLQPQLCASAQWMAQAMADHGFFDHKDHQGRNIDMRIPSFGYENFESISENIAAGQPTAKSVVESWMNSPGHRANILDPHTREIGIGHVLASTGKYRHYWVQNMGARFDVYPIVINDASGRTDNAQIMVSVHGPAQAEQMRLSNDGKHWSAWEPYKDKRAWLLEGALGKQTLYVEVKDGSKSFRAEAAVELIAPQEHVSVVSSK